VDNLDEGRDVGAVGAAADRSFNLGRQLGALADAIQVVDAQTDWVARGRYGRHFVPNISIGPPVVQSLRPYSTRFFDCHLMISDPARYFEAFKKAGADGCNRARGVANTASLISDGPALGYEWVWPPIPTPPIHAVVPYWATSTCCC